MHADSSMDTNDILLTNLTFCLLYSTDCSLSEIVLIGTYFYCLLFSLFLASPTPTSNCFFAASALPTILLVVAVVIVYLLAAAVVMIHALGASFFLIFHENIVE